MPNTAVDDGQSNLVKVRERESVNISCSSIGAPIPSIFWTINNHTTKFGQTDINFTNGTVRYDSPGQVVSVLHITNALYPQHNGQYQCMGVNYEGNGFQSSAYITVQVLGKNIINLNWCCSF